METLNVGEAKRRFSELIDRVLAGERFLVLRRGRPAVALVPPEEVTTDDQEPKPLGALAFVGALEDWEDLDHVVEEIYAARRRTKDRAGPSFD